jgi:hypothetical protein
VNAPGSANDLDADAFVGPFANHAIFAKKSTAVANEGDIVVTGERVYHYASPWIGSVSGTTNATGGWTEGGGPDGSGAGDTTTTPPDEASIDVTVKVYRPLTTDEQNAIEHLKASIASVSAAINALADEAIVTMPNGAHVTGARLKEIWAKTDFVIYDHEAFGNNSYRGEASMINGSDPQISFDIAGDGLVAYDKFPGGMNYLVGHELGHLTQWGTPLVYSEITANDISRALLNGYGLPYLHEATYGYTSGAPMSFTVPAPPPPDGGSGGGGGWSNDEPL